MEKFPPTFADIGKTVRDLFDKGYPYGFLKFTSKMKMPNSVNMKVKASSETDRGQCTGSLQTLYKCDEYGITMRGKWSISNILEVELSEEDKLLQGLRLALLGDLCMVTGKTSTKAKAGYKHQYVHTTVDMDLKNNAGPIVNAATVLAYCNFLTGLQIEYSSAKSNISKNSFAVGYVNGDVALHTNVTNFTDFTGAVYHKVNDKTDLGMRLKWSGCSTPQFGIAAKYAFSDDCTLRCKFVSTSEVGGSLDMKVREGVRLTFSSLLNVKNMTEHGLKVGLGLTFDG